MKCDKCWKKIAKRRPPCEVCKGFFCSTACQTNHGCTAVDSTKKPRQQGTPFTCDLIVVHTSPSGGVPRNTEEIARFLHHDSAEKRPKIFAGDWYVHGTDMIKDGQRQIAWADYLKEKELTFLVPEGKTNKPGKGDGMPADYFVHSKHFAGRISIVECGRGSYDTLYGWKRRHRELSDHAPVLGAFAAPQFDEKGEVSKARQALDNADHSTSLSNDSLSQPCAQKTALPPPFEIISWNINHLGKLAAETKSKKKGTKDEPKRADRKRTRIERKAEALLWMLEFRPAAIVLQEINDPDSLAALLDTSKLGGYRYLKGAKVFVITAQSKKTSQQARERGRYTDKRQGFVEYFPIIYDPSQCSVVAVGLWDGEKNELVTDQELGYNSTRPAMVYRLTFDGNRGDGRQPPKLSNAIDECGAIIAIGANGDCLFNAIAAGHVDRGGQTTGAQLRSAVADALQHYEESIAAQLSSIIGDLEKLADLETMAGTAIAANNHLKKYKDLPITSDLRDQTVNAAVMWLQKKEATLWSGKGWVAYSAKFENAAAARDHLLARLREIVKDAPRAAAEAIVEAMGSVGRRLRPHLVAGLRALLEKKPVNWTKAAIKAYIDDMRDRGVYGGELEAFLAGVAVKRKLVIFEPGNGNRVVHDVPDDDDPIVLRYNGVDHYDLFRRNTAPLLGKAVAQYSVSAKDKGVKSIELQPVATSSNDNRAADVVISNNNAPELKTSFMEELEEAVLDDDDADDEDDEEDDDEDQDDDDDDDEGYDDDAEYVDDEEDLPDSDDEMKK